MPAKLALPNGRIASAISAAAITGAAVVATIVVVGQAQDTDAYRAAERIPVLGPVLTGVKAVWRKVYNP